MFEGKALGDKSLLHGTVIYRPQVTHVKGDGIHGDPARFQPRLVCDHQVGIHISQQYVLPVHEPHETVKGGGIGLACPYLAQAFQPVDDLPHENEEEKPAMPAVKGRGYVVGGESPSLPSQGSDDIFQPVGIFRYFFIQ